MAIFNSINSNFTGSNTFLGSGSGNVTLSGTFNVGLGAGSLTALTSGSENTAIGYDTLPSATSSSFNVIVGNLSGNLISTSVGQNTIVGANSFSFLTTGARNMSLGYANGSNYTSSESDNIIIASGYTGTAGEHNKIIIGVDGTGAYEQSSCHIAGDVTTARSITATTGDITITSGKFNLPITTSTVGIITMGGTSSPWMHGYGTENLFLGGAAGNFTTSSFGYNIGVGSSSLHNVSTGYYNTGIGAYSGVTISTGYWNTCLGYNAGYHIANGQGNTAVGFGTGSLGGPGSWNTSLGITSSSVGSGSSHTGTDSSNIDIGNAGVSGQSNVIRIGTQGSGSAQQNACYIAGINGVTPGATAKLTITDSNGQMGTLGAATNGQIPIGSTGANPVLGAITSTTGTLSVTNGAGTIDIETTPVLQTDTGFASWGGSGSYFDDTTLGSFTISRPGTGYINGVLVTWTAPQTVTGLTAGNTYYIYIDNTGTIQKTPTRTDALYQNNIVLFECLRDSTSPTNNQKTVKENHPFGFPVEASNYQHHVVNTVIDNFNNGANIVLVGTQGIGISGTDTLDDHGVTTSIPDSGGSPITWNKYYTNAGGKWALQNTTNTFTGFWNNAGTPTALTAGRFGVYTLYASKDNLTTSTPDYFAVLNTAQFTTQAAANTAIANGTIAQASAELAQLEVVQLGYIVYRQSTATITVVTISKTTLRQTLSTSGTNTAALVTTDTTNFDYNLSPADTNVQSALDTLDNFNQWQIITADQSVVNQQKYICNKAGLLTLTLPTTADVGTTFEVTGMNTALGWKIAQNSGQQIFFGTSATTSGATGYISSTNIYDSVRLTCNVANVSWIVVGSMGNITVF